jgi:hypothetical protein
MRHGTAEGCAAADEPREKAEVSVGPARTGVQTF